MNIEEIEIPIRGTKEDHGKITKIGLQNIIKKLLLKKKTNYYVMVMSKYILMKKQILCIKKIMKRKCISKYKILKMTV